MESAVWNLATKPVRSKRKQDIPEGRKAKKQKLEKLENWGESEEIDAVDIRTWLKTTNISEEKAPAINISGMSFPMIGWGGVVTMMEVDAKLKSLPTGWKIYQQVKQFQSTWPW